MLFCLQFGTLVLEIHLTKVKAVSSLSHILACNVDHLSRTDNEFYDYRCDGNLCINILEFHDYKSKS